MLAALAPEIEWVESPQSYLPHRGTHRSPAEIADKVFGMVADNFDEFAVVPEHLHDAGRGLLCFAGDLPDVELLPRDIRPAAQ